MKDASYEQRVRDSFSSVVSIQEAISNQPKKMLETLFTLHPDVLMHGYSVRFAQNHNGGQVWIITNHTSEVVFSGLSALSAAEFLKTL